MKCYEIAPASRLFGICKGEPGSGKSIFEASFPGVCFLDIDDRMRSVRNYYPNRTDIDYFPIRSYQELENKINELQKYNPFNCVVVSSITSLARTIMRHAIELRGGGKGSMKKAGIFVNTVEDYSGETQGLINCIFELKYHLQCHVWFEAHVTDASKIAVGISRRMVTGAKALASEIPAYFDEVYHFQVIPSMTRGERPQYTIITSATDADYAKTSLPLPPIIDITNGNGYEILMSYLPEEVIKEDIQKLKEEASKIVTL
jgi:hypothetical protein